MSTPPSARHGRIHLEQQRKRAKELLARLDAIDFAVRHPSFAADDEAGTWHWRCGNDIAHSLERAGFRGRFAPALRRQLQELPGRHDGLSLTERLALQIVRDPGRPPLGEVFAGLHGVREPLPHLGDAMFFALTTLGQQVLQGHTCWRDHADSERWVGGIRIAPGEPRWTLDTDGAPHWRTGPSTN